MQSHRHSQNAMQPELERPLLEQQRIDNALLTMSTRLGRSLSADRVSQWHKDFSPYPIQAIEHALDQWALTNKTLPSPADVAILVRVWRENNEPIQQCEPECQERHGKGYHTNDLMWLWKERQKSDRPWTDLDYDTAMLRLDRTRQGGAPEWRR